MQIKSSLVHPFRMNIEQTRLTKRFEDFHPYATGFLVGGIDHPEQFLTKGIDVISRRIEADNEMKGQ